MLSVWFLLSYCPINLISFWPPVCPRGFNVLSSEGFLSLIGFYVKDISLLYHCCLFFVSVLLLSHCCLLLVLCLLYHCYILLVLLLSLHAIAISLPSFIGSDLYCLRGFLSHCYLLILCYCHYYCCLVSLLSLVSLDVLLFTPMLLSLLLPFGISYWVLPHWYLLISLLSPLSLLLSLLSLITAIWSMLLPFTTIHYHSCYSLLFNGLYSLPFIWSLLLFPRWLESTTNDETLMVTKGKKRSVIANKDNVNFEVDRSCNVLSESKVAGFCCL